MGWFKFIAKQLFLVILAVFLLFIFSILWERLNPVFDARFFGFPISFYGGNTFCLRSDCTQRFIWTSFILDLLMWYSVLRLIGFLKGKISSYIIGKMSI